MISDKDQNSLRSALEVGIMKNQIRENSIFMKKDLCFILKTIFPRFVLKEEIILHISRLNS